jgi:hypothetical protein
MESNTLSFELSNGTYFKRRNIEVKKYLIAAFPTQGKSLASHFHLANELRSEVSRCITIMQVV